MKSEVVELTALKTAYQQQDPILMYFWTPHWAQSKYDLSMIKLPEVTQACTDEAANDPSKYACAYEYTNFGYSEAAFALAKAMGNAQWEDLAEKFFGSYLFLTCARRS